MSKILMRCPECGGNGVNCSRCHGSGVVEIEVVGEVAPGPTFEAAANDALAKKCDELEAENAQLHKQIRRLVQEREEQQAKRYNAEAKITRLTAENEDLCVELSKARHTVKAQEDALLHTESVRPVRETRNFSYYTSVLSAAERAAGKVSGPAQAALVALAVELRRRT